MKGSSGREDLVPICSTRHLPLSPILQQATMTLMPHSTASGKKHSAPYSRMQHETPLLNFGTGVLMSSNLLRPQNNQTSFIVAIDKDTSKYKRAKVDRP